MRAVFLDFDTVGPGDVDSAPLFRLLPELELHAHTPPELVAERLADAALGGTDGRPMFGSLVEALAAAA